MTSERTGDCRGSCRHCETVVTDISPPGSTFFFWPPQQHTAARLVRVLRDAEHAPRVAPGATCLAVTLDGDTDSVLTRLRAELTPPEQAGTRVLVHHGPGRPRLADLGQAVTFAELAARHNSAWLARMLADERLISAFQPIAEAAHPGSVAGREALLRGIADDGSIVPAADLFPAAEAAGLLFQLDLAGRLCAIRCAAAQPHPGYLFINFAPTAIYDPAYCLRSTVRAIDEAGLEPGRIVFELTETHRAHDIDHLRRILTFYRSAGFLVALDDLGAGFSGLNLLHELRPDFVKFDRQLARDVGADAYRATILAHMLACARDLGVRTVVEGIESADDLAWVQAHGADLVQGYYIGRPALPAAVREATG